MYARISLYSDVFQLLLHQRNEKYGKTLCSYLFANFKHFLYNFKFVILFNSVFRVSNFSRERNLLNFQRKWIRNNQSRISVTNVPNFEKI